MISLNRSSLAALASTSLFVLLWSSAAIISKWGLAHASPMVFLIARFGTALVALLTLSPLIGLRWPRERKQVRHAVLTGLVMLGIYPIFYLMALDLHVTPGVIATVLGVQPMLTSFLLERRHSAPRLGGLALGLIGLVMVVYQSIGLSGLTFAGLACCLLALLSITGGSILQKNIRENPLGTLPLQYMAGLALCIAVAPFQPLHVEWNAAFILSALWMGLMVSVLATVLLYRMIAAGNLVNVTSLFYLVPAVTALMDYAVFGNRLSALGLLGMGLIVLGLMLVFRPAVPASESKSTQAMDNR
ncbi:membrane protein [Pseudomonas sp. ATCC 13867]|uniref:DMT family transporter n=1 Tax=Pseudomonas sp. ATCC 13867 TaxID=1294143 RepID=UPI0002C4EEA4|nr:DMT family transporter [Pseudomonas sp. ATCC 13867]AGI23486.1 membrane protein [Pseudomonas sp. ATCC 13867]RFQ42246.1 DMT family transporter [Pseudomonas sp. ATCC 13867]